MVLKVKKKRYYFYIIKILLRYYWYSLCCLLALKKKSETCRWEVTSCLWFFFFSPTDISFELVPAAVGLITSQLYGRAPYGKRHCVSSLCAVVRQAGSWGSLKASTVSFLWLAWMARWWKMEITSGPTARARFCPWEPHLFKKDILCHGAQADFCAHFYEYLREREREKKKGVWILFRIQSKNSLFQMLLHSLTASRCSEVSWMFFSSLLYRDLPQGRQEICIHPVVSYNSQSHIVLTHLTFYVSASI